MEVITYRQDVSPFAQAFLAGKQGFNFGLTTGIRTLDRAINGIQKKTSIGVAAAPKVGKTTLVDFCFLVCPYMQMLTQGRIDDIDWIYNSYEIDRVNKEFKIAALFMFKEYGIFDFEYKGAKYTISHDYLLGKLVHRNENDTIEQVPVLKEHEEILKEVYSKRLVPIFGEYDSNNKKIAKGKVDFIEEKTNPTGARNYLLKYFRENGTQHFESYKTYDDNHNEVVRQRLVGYTEKNPRKFTIVITDHIRKFHLERKFTIKQNMDKWLEYSTEFVNTYNATMVNICHSNREVANVERLKFAGDTIFPTADDVKDTGNLAEESHILLTMLNPNDERYNLKQHFGVDLTENKHPFYRSIHVADARWVECPQHIQVNMFGNINYFEPLKKSM